MNTLYKILAAIIQRRIAQTLDKHLQNTQYGFRKDRSTADAIHLIRRVIEYGESTRNQLHLMLLDWEKAFDKVDPEGLVIALKRMNARPSLIINVQNLYHNPQFYTELDHNPL